MARIERIVMACALVAACKGKDDKGGGGGGGGGGDFPDELAKFMPANAASLFQGIWQTRISFYKGNLDTPAALEITGEKATASDGTNDHTLTFEIDSPCTFRLSEKMNDTNYGTAYYDKHFLAAGGKLAAVGDGAAGYRKGKEAIVCQIGPDSVITSDASGKCKSWRRDSFNKKWNDKPIDCAWSTKDGKDAFTAGKAGDQWASTLIADGDLLWTDQLRDEVKAETFMKHASAFATAKAWATEQNKPKK